MALALSVAVPVAVPEHGAAKVIVKLPLLPLAVPVIVPCPGIAALKLQAFCATITWSELVWPHELLNTPLHVPPTFTQDGAVGPPLQAETSRITNSHKGFLMGPRFLRRRLSGVAGDGAARGSGRDMSDEYRGACLSRPSSFLLPLGASGLSHLRAAPA